LFPRIKSKAAGRSAPPLSAVCVFLPLGGVQTADKADTF
jgi:hypothetical protein